MVDTIILISRQNQPFLIFPNGKSSFLSTYLEMLRRAMGVSPASLAIPGQVWELISHANKVWFLDY